NLVTDELGEVLVRLTIRHNVVEIGEPFRKSWLRPQLFIAIEPLFARDIERIAHVEGVIEAERRFANPLMDFLRVLLELALRLGADGAIAQRRTVIRRALEDRELADVLGDLRDQLNRRRTGPDYRDALAGEVHTFLRPATRMDR